MLYERFRDQSAIDLHVTLEHFAQILRDFAELAERASRSSLISTS